MSERNYLFSGLPELAGSFPFLRGMTIISFSILFIVAPIEWLKPLLYL